MFSAHQTEVVWKVDNIKVKGNHNIHIHIYILFILEHIFRGPKTSWAIFSKPSSKLRHFEWVFANSLYLIAVGSWKAIVSGCSGNWCNFSSQHNIRFLHKMLMISHRKVNKKVSWIFYSENKAPLSSKYIWIKIFI